MVLTRRAYKAISRWLPNEIIAEIIQAAPKSDQASLCRVSKLFHALCLPILYRVVHLQTSASVEAFCTAVLSNTALSELVRSFTSGFGRGPFHLRTGHLVVKSSKSLLQLQCLSVNISLLEQEHLQELLRSTFPHLVQCDLGTHIYHWTSTEREDSLASFLLRHPSLETLHIQDWLYGQIQVWPSTSARIPLRHLQKLRCPVRIVPSIVSDTLKEARLDWYDAEPNEVEAIFVALKSMARMDIPFICRNDSGDKFVFEIMNSLSRNIPHTKVLELKLLESSGNNGTSSELPPNLRKLGVFIVEILSYAPTQHQLGRRSENSSGARGCVSHIGGGSTEKLCMEESGRDMGEIPCKGFHGVDRHLRFYV
ncbi:hypothetical protein FB451DRAFT_1361557, partial [Mycena latifolia]